MLAFILIFILYILYIKLIQFVLHVEGHHPRLCLYPDCLLLAMGCSCKCIGLALHILGGFTKGLVVSDTPACIRLL